LSAIIDLYHLIRRGKFDIVHTYTPVAGVVGRIAAHFAGVPVIIHSVLGSLLVDEVPTWQRLLYLTSERMLGRWTNLFITLNDADSRDLIKHHIAPQAKVASLRYEFGVDLAEFNPERIDERQVEALRHEFGLELDIPVVGFVGRLVGEKGILDLFDAFAAIRQRGHQVKLLFVGDVLISDRDQESVRELKRRVAEEGLEDEVIFTGFREDVPALIALMDVVVLPSYREGFPRIPIEAAAMGKPAITTATRGHEVAVIEGETGLVVPISDVNSLAQAIERLIGDPVLAQRMGTAGLRRARELFDEQKILEQQIVYYAKAIHNASSVGLQAIV